MSLEEYRRKRRFDQTPEPPGEVKPGTSNLLYVIQKHAASHLHYDLRLEMEGVLKSWAVPKGPSLNPTEKRLAVQVEDHPIEYGRFEGIIPKGQYGSGTVMVWDSGTWEPSGDSRKGLSEGRLKFIIHGKKLKGAWFLVRTRFKGEGKNWLLIKEKDGYAQKGISDLLLNESLSAATERTMEEIASEADRVWNTEGPAVEANPSVRPPLDPWGNLSALPGVRPGSFPEKMTPQMAVLVKQPPPGDGWAHEIKYDGYRIMAFRNEKGIRLLSRNGKEWTYRFPSIVESLKTLSTTPFVLDGEVVVMAEDGTTDFQALQNALKGKPGGRMVYYAFDLPFLGNFDLSRTPLLERKKVLAELLSRIPKMASIRFSDHIIGQGKSVYEMACQQGVEGIVSKRMDSPYRQQRSNDWLKIKCLNRQEFVVVGFSQPSGTRNGFGALLLGYYTPSRKLIYAGRVGTGFTRETLHFLYGELEKIKNPTSPLSDPLKGQEAKGVTWVYPKLVAEVEYRAWTEEGILRQPSFKGMREDKDPREVIRETPVKAHKKISNDRQEEPGEVSKGMIEKIPSRNKAVMITGVRVTHPNKILYSEQGITKADLVRYYEQISDWILPHIVYRPLTIVRCPSGREECFYQKNLTEELPPFLKGVVVPGKDEAQTYIMIEDLPGLIALVQIGVLEIHPWPSRSGHLEYPDRMIFDMDPDPGVSPGDLVEGCLLLRNLLQALGLRSFLKTTGGKGFHLVVPLLPENHWQEVKEFAKAVAESLVKSYPRLFVATMSKTKRKDKIYVDYLRNHWEATAVAPYSTRARAGAPISTPLSWQELSDHLKPDDFTIENLPRRLASLPEDPWDDFFSIRQSLNEFIKRER
jgi:bifunctional non-homologous end joining protein LigD